MERTITEQIKDLEAKLTLLHMFRDDCTSVRMGRRLQLVPEASRFENRFGDEIAEAEEELKGLQARTANHHHEQAA